MNSDILSEVLTAVKRYQMLSRGDTVVVGLSGGADSMTLLSVLNGIKSEYDLQLAAAHVNHGLRGEEALRDEMFAKEFCDSLGVEFRVLHADVPSLSKELGMSFEECGRHVRYKFFEEVALSFCNEGAPVGGVKIATAHNAQDVAETFLYNLTRGTGLRGLSGIPPVRTLEKSGISVIRPLIGCTRDDIESYLEGVGIGFVTDSTNADSDYARNRIRLNVLPELREINSHSTENIVRCAESLRADSEFLEELANAALSRAHLGDESYDTQILSREKYPVLARAAAQILFEKSGVHPEKVHIDKATELIINGGGADLTGGVHLRVENGRLFFTDVEEKEQPQFCVSADILTEKLYALPWADISFEVSTLSDFEKKVDKTCENDNKKRKLILENALDYDKIKSNFIVRNRRFGDKIRLPKRKLSKTLKNLFNEAKLPPRSRDTVTIIEKDGELAWLEGFGASEGYAVSADTKNILIVSVVRR